jgi:hypothetical protein
MVQYWTECGTQQLDRQLQPQQTVFWALQHVIGNSANSCRLLLPVVSRPLETTTESATGDNIPRYGSIAKRAIQWHAPSNEVVTGKQQALHSQ